MVKIQHFSESLEKNFEEIGVEIEKQKENPDNRHLPEREVVSKAIKTISVSKTEVEEKKDEGEERGYSNLPKYISPDKEPIVAEEVNNLISTAFKDGIFEATKRAKKHSLFVQDALHDALVDKVLPELKKRGLIK